MISIVIPAHNESSVIARTLTTLLRNARPDEIGVTVVCNGCTDNTAQVARRFSPAVQVIESDVASKSHALNLGDQTFQDFPRIYVDADIAITVDAIRALASRLERGDVLVVAPKADINLTDCSWLVRKYFGIRSCLPSSREGIGGSGVYALSAAGRRRFTKFPDIIADDTYVRLQFKPEERETLADIKSTVFVPRTILQLLKVRTRAYMGNLELASHFPELLLNKGKTNYQAVGRLFKEPRLWLGLLIYCFVNFFARCRAAILTHTRTSIWQRDDTSRVASALESSGYRPKLLAVSSGGGHWVQLLRIKPAFEDCTVTFVTVHASYHAQVPEHKFYVVSDANRWNLFGLFKAACKLAWIIWNERPDVVVSTGAAPGYAALRLGRVFGARTIWLDSIANVEKLSLSGLRIGTYADLWLTQWPHLARPNGPHYAGTVL